MVVIACCQVAPSVAMQRHVRNIIKGMSARPAERAGPMVRRPTDEAERGRHFHPVTTYLRDQEAACEQRLCCGSHFILTRRHPCFTTPIHLWPDRSRGSSQSESQVVEDAPKRAPARATAAA